MKEITNAMIEPYKQRFDNSKGRIITKLENRNDKKKDSDKRKSFFFLTLGAIIAVFCFPIFFELSLFETKNMNMFFEDLKYFGFSDSYSYAWDRYIDNVTKIGLFIIDFFSSSLKGENYYSEIGFLDKLITVSKFIVGNIFNPISTLSFIFFVYLSQSSVLNKREKRFQALKFYIYIFLWVSVIYIFVFGSFVAFPFFRDFLYPDFGKISVVAGILIIVLIFWLYIIWFAKLKKM